MIWMRRDHTLTGVYVPLYNMKCKWFQNACSDFWHSCHHALRTPRHQSCLGFRGPWRNNQLFASLPLHASQSQGILLNQTNAMTTVLRLPLLHSVPIAPSWKPSVLSPSGMYCCCSCLLSDTLSLPLPSMKWKCLNTKGLKATRSCYMLCGSSSNIHKYLGTCLFLSLCQLQYPISVFPLQLSRF